MGSDPLTSPTINETQLASDAGTPVEVTSAPAVTRMDATVTTTVQGDVEVARLVRSQIGAEEPHADRGRRSARVHCRLVYLRT